MSSETASGGSIGPFPIDWERFITNALVTDEDLYSHAEPEPERFHPSQLAKCKRQAYLSKLGWNDTSEWMGTFQTGTLIHEWLERHVIAHDRLKAEVPVEVELDGITIVGHADVYDPDYDVVYDFKSRKNWHYHSPPVDRHIDQMNLYMAALDATHGQVVYLAKADLETRPWPEGELFEYDQERVDSLIATAKEIRDEIEANGIPEDPDGIPFEKCGCFMCDGESLRETPLALELQNGTPASALEAKLKE